MFVRLTRQPSEYCSQFIKYSLFVTYWKTRRWDAITFEPGISEVIIAQSMFNYVTVKYQQLTR